MAKFLLVHGSLHGAWCWRDLIPALAALDHEATAIDMPGHGENTTPLREVTLDAYRDAVLAASDASTVIVGHSMAGYPISAAAEKNPGGMRGLVYVAAYVPAPGKSLAQMRALAARQPLAEAIARNPDGISFGIQPEKVKPLFYHDCTDAVVEYARAHLTQQAVAPLDTPVTLSANYARVPRAYIRCMDDRAVVPELQVSITEDWPEETVHEMPTSHSPFFSDPQGLARLLDRIAGRF